MLSLDDGSIHEAKLCADRPFNIELATVSETFLSC